VVLIGAAGSGKSTLAQATWPGQVLSSDHYREVITGDEGSQEVNREVFTVLHFLAEARLRRKLLTVVDATSAYGKDRAPLLKLARRYEVPAVAAVVLPPLGLVLERNAGRARKVPEHVITRQHQAVTDSLLTLRAEGFWRIIFSGLGGQS
jgi:predicted kinase